MPGISGAISTPAGTPASFSFLTASNRLRGDGVWGSVVRQALVDRRHRSKTDQLVMKLMMLEGEGS